MRMKIVKMPLFLNINDIVKKIYLIDIGLIIFLCGFVFIEPSLVEYLMVISVPLLFLKGKVYVFPLFAGMFLLLVNLLNVLLFVNYSLMASFEVNFLFLVKNVYMLFIFLFFAATSLDRGKKNLLRLIFNLWTLSVLVNVLAYLFGVFLSKKMLFGAHVVNYGIRFEGFFKDPNVLGPFIVVPLIYWIYRCFERCNTEILSIIGILFFALFFTFSRGAYLNFTIAFLFIFVVFSRRKGSNSFKPLLLSLLVILVFFIIIWILNPSIFGINVQMFVRNRLKILEPYDVYRFRAQKEAFEIVKQFPIFGIGVGNYNTFVHYAAHNTYLRLLGEQGLLGFSAYLLFFVAVLFDRGRILIKKVERGFFEYAVIYGCFLGILTESFFIDTLHWRHLWILLGLLFAI